MRRFAAVVPLVLALALAVGMGCSRKLSVPPAPAGFRFLSPVAGDTVPGLSAFLRFQALNFTLEPPDGTVHEGAGHFDVSIDGAPPLHVATDTLTVRFDTAGAHSVVIELKRGDETSLDPPVRIERTVVLSLIVLPPSIHILAPAEGDTIRTADFHVKVELHNFVLDPPGSPPAPGHGRILLNVLAHGGAVQLVAQLPAESASVELRSVFDGPGKVRVLLLTNELLPLPQPVGDSIAVVFVPEVSLRRDVQPIFTANCGIPGCHSPAAGPPVLGEDLSTHEGTRNTAVNVTSLESPSKKRILPGNAGLSYTVDKIKGIQSVGSQMPLGNPPLTPEQIQAIVDWINQGARDN